MKFRVPEIVLGALLAAALFSMGFLAASSYYDIRNTAALETKGKGSPAEDRLANYTLALVVLNVFLVGSTALLWWATKRSAEIAERALTELEAPFVALNIIDDPLGDTQTPDGRPTTLDTIRYGFYNHGRTPAVLLELQDKLQVCEEGKLPTLEWTGRKTIYPYGVFIGPNMPSAPSTRVFKDYFTPGERGMSWRVTLICLW